MKKVTTLAAVLVMGASALIACGATECGPDEVRSEDHGCIEKDDLDLNNDGSFEDEEREWDDD